MYVIITRILIILTHAHTDTHSLSTHSRHTHTNADVHTHKQFNILKDFKSYCNIRHRACIRRLDWDKKKYK
jgi:hypothetical protein